MGIVEIYKDKPNTVWVNDETFLCVFNNENYVKMSYLLLESIINYGNLGNNTDILIYTSTPFMNMIKQSHLFIDKIKLMHCNKVG